MKENGKAAIVLPTGFITAQSGIDKKFANIWWKTNARGVVSMPSNIFATTGTNVSILFIDKTNKDKVVLIDAQLGRKIKDGKNQKPYFPRRRTKKSAIPSRTNRQWKISAWWSATMKLKPKTTACPRGSISK
ncbi:MAG: N-6 DNA methylase [Haemophilus parainfluenzae]